ncbi:MAG: nucleoside hydrolase-like domain-containing protein, partial [Bacteroidota bacterium]
MKLIRHLLFVALCLGGILSFAQDKPRVFVFTDVNINSGDPDDRQSLVHLFWYADELNIEGIVPDRWEAQGYEACGLAVDAYEKDYSILRESDRGYPSPQRIREKIAKDWPMAQQLFQAAASDTTAPLYVLIWGNMERFRDALLMDPSVADNLRVITIATGVMLESSIPHLPESWGKSPPCEQMNWNAFGRN